jgi:hypothetical protein
MLFGYYETRRKLAWLNRNNMIVAGLTLALGNALLGRRSEAASSPRSITAMLGLPLPPGFYLTNSFLFEVAIALTVMGAATLILDNLGHPREEDPEANADLAKAGIGKTMNILHPLPSAPLRGRHLPDPAPQRHPRCHWAGTALERRQPVPVHHRRLQRSGRGVLAPPPRRSATPCPKPWC